MDGSWALWQVVLVMFFIMAVFACLVAVIYDLVKQQIDKRRWARGVTITVIDYPRQSNDDVDKFFKEIEEFRNDISTDR